MPCPWGGFHTLSTLILFMLGTLQALGAITVATTRWGIGKAHLHSSPLCLLHRRPATDWGLLSDPGWTWALEGHLQT